MPNWCSNILFITPVTEEAAALLTKAVTTGNLLNTLKPLPDELRGTPADFMSLDDPRLSDEERAKRQALVEKYGYDNWYDWCVRNWGTKWDVDMHEENPEVKVNCTTGLSFDSAWSPPLELYASLPLDQFIVKAHYWEPGMAYIGSWSSARGEYEYVEYADGESSIKDAPDAEEAFDATETIESWRED
jgi:hypothetical protein